MQRLEGDIRPLADRIMQILLQLLSGVGPKSSVPDTAFAAIGSIATALDDDFIKYMEAFAPYLYNALGNQEEPGLCSMAIGLVSDITRSLGEKVQPFCDAFMNYLLENLKVSLMKIGACVSRANNAHRAAISATSSSRLSFSALVILHRQLAVTSRLIFLWSLRCCSKHRLFL